MALNDGNQRNPTDNKNLQQTQAQVDEVVGIMRVNIEKVLERDERLTELDGRAEMLQQGAYNFEQQAMKLKRKYWWKNCKFMQFKQIPNVFTYGSIRLTSLRFHQNIVCIIA
ncbi:vesicle-associated membrane protein 3-like isoform X1 [Centruroides sculpturatus]|uniref:vesicle-associated membrane protein 3-like isoform X1 n=1 Tax=Centruroides sculpturatus TaxID=218467 RepID=UPI000C6CA896|nr:vesicle-associated membrane protein 3-like isoform X1 [Centruroides sculpturatus]